VPRVAASVSQPFVDTGITQQNTCITGTEAISRLLLPPGYPAARARGPTIPVTKWLFYNGSANGIPTKISAITREDLVCIAGYGELSNDPTASCRPPSPLRLIIKGLVHWRSFMKMSAGVRRFIYMSSQRMGYMERGCHRESATNPQTDYGGKTPGGAHVTPLMTAQSLCNATFGGAFTLMCALTLCSTTWQASAWRPLKKSDTMMAPGVFLGPYVL